MLQVQLFMHFEHNPRCLITHVAISLFSYLLLTRKNSDELTKIVRMNSTGSLEFWQSKTQDMMLLNTEKVQHRIHSDDSTPWK